MRQKFRIVLFYLSFFGLFSAGVYLFLLFSHPSAFERYAEDDRSNPQLYWPKRGVNYIETSSELASFNPKPKTVFAFDNLGTLNAHFTAEQLARHAKEELISEKPQIKFVVVSGKLLRKFREYVKRENLSLDVCGWNGDFVVVDQLGIWQVIDREPNSKLTPELMSSVVDWLRLVD